MYCKTMKLLTLVLGLTFAITGVSYGQFPGGGGVPNPINTLPRVGKPAGNTQNFFNTSVNNQFGDALNGVLGHNQLGPFGSVEFSNARWIALGQPAIPGQEFYGLRIQDRLHTATLSLNGSATNTSVKDLEFQWGGPSTPLLRFNYLTSPFSERQVMSLNQVGVLEVANFNNNPSLVKLDVQGSAALTGNLFQNSDRRLKENVLPLRTDSIGNDEMSTVTQKLLQLEGVTYQLIADEDGLDQIGFIAQDMEKLFPELVVQDEEGTYSVNYSGLIPVLVE